MSSGLFKVIATFEDTDGKPLSGKEYTVQLYDEDRFLDDKLDKAKLDINGRAEFLVSVADIKSIDSLDERTPDLYFILEKNGIEIFRSTTIPDVNFETENPVTGRTDNLTQAFGPFRIEQE
ncbi:MAG: hypothetical protein KAJ03_09670 [Gammaproteobacteria bacterium]|nr:hypothetical protein [Gammaproteobacteria bacterium]